MSEHHLLVPGRGRIDVTVIDGCSGSADPRQSCPAGHALNRARVRHLLQSAWVVVTDDSTPIGLAAYRPVDSDVRVVHEFLVDRTLPGADTAHVADLLLSAIERVACVDGIRCLMLLLDGDEALVPFERRGYTAVLVDPAVAWMQKTFDRSGSASRHSTH